jgi:hypothetical protein
LTIPLTSRRRKMGEKSTEKLCCLTYWNALSGVGN